MMGGLRKDLRNWNQRKIGTIYWKDKITEKIYWLLVPGEGKADVIVTPNYFSIFAKWFQKGIRFFMQGANLKEEMFTNREWNLPGLNFTVFPHKSGISVKKIQDVEAFCKRWAIRDVVEDIFEIHCSFRRKLIRQQAITLEPSSL